MWFLSLPYLDSFLYVTMFIIGCPLANLFAVTHVSRAHFRAHSQMGSGGELSNGAPGLGHHPLLKLSPQHLQAFYAKKLDEGLSPTTVISFHKMLHLALDKAVHWGLVPRNVCDAVEPPHVKRFEIQPLNTEQIQQFLTAARGHRLEALFVLALATGMCRGNCWLSSGEI